MIDLKSLGPFVVQALKDESAFLADYESNWAGVYGLAGRREAHVVFTIARALHAEGVRSILEDSYWECPDLRCDLAVRLDSARDEWAWLEVKTMPMEDATDKLASVHHDLLKLERALRANRTRNRCQGLVVVGYEGEEGDLARRFLKLAEAHGLVRWPYRIGMTGITSFDLHQPSVTRHSPHYVRCVVGYWARRDLRSRALACDGRCYLKRG